MEEFTKEELRWIIEQAKQKQKTIVGRPLPNKVFEIERRAVKKLTLTDVGCSKSFKCCKESDKCSIQCNDCNMVYNY
jgi:actin-like ATPase involved in cell morphogenesis